MYFPFILKRNEKKPFILKRNVLPLYFKNNWGHNLKKKKHNHQRYCCSHEKKPFILRRNGRIPVFFFFKEMYFHFILKRNGKKPLYFKKKCIYLLFLKEFRAKRKKKKNKRSPKLLLFS